MEHEHDSGGPAPGPEAEQPAPVVVEQPAAGPAQGAALGFGRAGAPATARTGPWLDRLAYEDPRVRAAALGRLQRSGGNAALSRMLVQRREDSDLAAQEMTREKEEIKRLGITIDLERASEGEKLNEIRRLGSSGPAASRVWRSFGGDAGKVALANRELFEAALKADADLIKLPGFEELRAKFQGAVEGKVLGNLQANRDFVLQEMQRLGVAGEDKEPTAEQDAQLRETQLLAEQVQKAQDGMAKAHTIPVGWDYTEVPGASGRTKYEKGKAFFNPAMPPQVKGEGGDFEDYAEVKKHYDQLDLGVKSILAHSPAVYAIVGDKVGGPRPGTAAGGLAGASGKDARAQIKPALEELARKIDEAVPLVGTKLDYRDFLPVHDQLMKTPEWSRELEKAFIANEVRDREMGKMLTALGLSALSAAGFILANMASAGLATFLIVAGTVASGAQAKFSIDDYVAKSKAAEAKTGDPSLDIISKEQVDSALFQAILDTALAFIDVASGVGAVVKRLTPGFKLVQAAEAGTKAFAPTALKEALATGEGAARAIENSVKEIGVQGTLTASGRSPRALAEIVGAESELGQKLLAAGEAGAAGGKAAEKLAGDLANLSKLAAHELEPTVRAGMAQYGYVGTIQRAGGWKALTKALGEESAIVKELEAWRSTLVQEAIDFLEKTSKSESSAVRTGTEKGTSDVDVSTFGKDAAQNVERAKEYMAKRVGVGRDKLEFMLDADAAVNPARMHLQDVAKGLSPQTYAAIEREAARHQETLVANRRWYDAVQAGDKPLQEKLAKEAGERGVTIDKSWAPLTAEQVAGAERRMDKWAQQLADLEKSGATEAQKQALIQDIGRTQAEVLATNPNMYATGGAIRQNVSTRPRDKEKIEEALGVKFDKPPFPASRYTAILGEGPFLDKAIAAIRSSEKVQDIVKALKDFGKHGERVTQALGRDIAVTGIDAGKMDDLAKQLLAWVEKAQTPELAAEVAREGIPAIRRQIEKQLGALTGSMEHGIGALRNQAELGAALTAEESANLAAWVRAQANAQARADALLANIAALEQQLAGGQALGKGLSVGTKAPGEPPAEGTGGDRAAPDQNASVPEPQMSGAP